jgi:hypothetical protein
MKRSFLLCMTLSAMALAQFAPSAMPRRPYPRPPGTGSLEPITGAPTPFADVSLQSLLREEVSSLAQGPTALRVNKINRAAGRQDEEATRFLLEAWSRSEVQLDPEASCALAWALAPRAAEPDVVRVLAAILETPERPAQLSYDTGYGENARAIAALALARQDDSLARTALFTALKNRGAKATVLRALEAYPPRTLPPGLANSAAVLQALIVLRDVRALPKFVEAMDANDPEIRALGFRGLRLLADGRHIARARKALVDGSPLVQRASAEYLVHLGAPERITIVEIMLTKPELVDSAIALSAMVDSAKVTEGLVAVAKRPGDARAAAVEALALYPSRHSALFDLHSQPDLRALSLSSWVRANAEWDEQRFAPLLSHQDATVRAAAYNAYTLWSLHHHKRDAKLVAQATTCAAARGASESDACVFLLSATENRSEYASAKDAQTRRVALSGLGGAPLAASDLATREFDSVNQGLLLLRGATYTHATLRRFAKGRTVGSIHALDLLAQSSASEDRSVVRASLDADGVLYRSAIYGAWSRSEAASAQNYLEPLRREVDSRARRAALQGLVDRLRNKPEERSLDGLDAAITLLANVDPDAEIRKLARQRTKARPPEAPIWLQAQGRTDVTGYYATHEGTIEPVVFQRSGDAIVNHAGLLPGELWMLP